MTGSPSAIFEAHGRDRGAYPFTITGTEAAPRTQLRQSSRRDDLADGGGQAGDQAVALRHVSDAPTIPEVSDTRAEDLDGSGEKGSEAERAA